ILRGYRLEYSELARHPLGRVRCSPHGHFRSVEQNCIHIVLLNITNAGGGLMSATSVQFTVAAHIMATLGFHHAEKEIPSATIAEGVNADPTFVRKSLSKLSKAGLISTTRGKNGASRLTRSPK